MSSKNDTQLEPKGTRVSLSQRVSAAGTRPAAEPWALAPTPIAQPYTAAPSAALVTTGGEHNIQRGSAEHKQSSGAAGQVCSGAESLLVSQLPNNHASHCNYIFFKTRDK